MGRLLKARQALESKLTTQQKDMMLLPVTELKKHHTSVALLSLIEGFCRHDKEVESLQKMADCELEHHKLEASNSGLAT